MSSSRYQWWVKSESIEFCTNECRAIGNRLSSRQMIKMKMIIKIVWTSWCPQCRSPFRITEKRLPWEMGVRRRIITYSRVIDHVHKVRKRRDPRRILTTVSNKIWFANQHLLICRKKSQLPSTFTSHERISVDVSIFTWRPMMFALLSLLSKSFEHPSHDVLLVIYIDSKFLFSNTNGRQDSFRDINHFFCLRHADAVTSALRQLLICRVEYRRI